MSSWPTSSSLRKCQRLKSNFLPVLTRRPFRTGYTHMREMHMELFGQDILGRTDKDWGLDEEGEINGSYRPCGFPGVGHRSLIGIVNGADRVSRSSGSPPVASRPSAFISSS